MLNSQAASSHRIRIIDIVRGVAVLGIFAINIQEMAFPEELAFYFQFDDKEQYFSNFVGISIEILFYGKMRGLFAILFGVSSMLIIQTLTDPETGSIDARYYFRRLMWLAAFGLLNSYLFLWWGDILFKYALLGALLFPLRLASTRSLVVLAMASLTVLTAQPYLRYSEIAALKEKVGEVERNAQQGQVITPEAEEIKDKWQERQGDLQPNYSLIDDGVRIKTGEYSALFKYVAWKAFEEQTTIFYQEDFFDIFLYMVIGIILFRLDFFGRRYARQPLQLAIALFGLSLGFLVHAWINWGLLTSRLDPLKSEYYQIFFDIGRLPFVIGYLSLIIFLFHNELLKFSGDCLAAVGRMALSNYLLQSVIGVFLFYGIGLGQFNQLTRSEIAIIIVVVWTFQITFSVMWMAAFYYGPFEWVWRSLTYSKIQPLRKA